MARVLVAVLALALAWGVTLGGGSVLVERTSGGYRPKAVKPPMQRWGYTADDVASYWRGFRDAGIDAERRFLEADLVFPLIYGAALLASMLWLRAALGSSFSPALCVMLVGVTVLADWAENLVHLREIAPFLTDPEYTPDAGWIAFSSAATMAKLASVGASLLLVSALALASIVRGARS